MTVLPVFGLLSALAMGSATATPLAERVIYTGVTGIRIGNWTEAYMITNDQTPKDKGAWGDLGPSSFDFRFTPEGADGGYRREDFEVVFYKHKGNWWDIRQSWYGDTPVEKKLKKPKVDKTIACSLVASRALTSNDNHFEITDKSPFISPAESDGVTAVCKKKKK